MESIFFTLICSLFAAFYFIANDIFRLRGDVFVFWRSLFLGVGLLPLLPLMNWGHPPSFYIVIAVGSLLAGCGDIMMFEANKHYSAASLSRVVVARNIVMFLLWPILLSDYRARLIENGLVLWGSLALILASTWALNHMRKSPVNAAIIRTAIPIMLFFVGCDMLLAFAVHGKPNAGDALFSVWIAGAVNSVLSAIVVAVHSRRERRNLFVTPGWFKVGAVNALLFFAMVFTKTLSIAWLENPGYFGAMMAIYTFWLYLLHKYWLKQKDATDPRMGFVVVACSILLGLLSVQIPRF
jgi:hypothetical protein